MPLLIESIQKYVAVGGGKGLRLTREGACFSKEGWDDRLKVR